MPDIALIWDRPTIFEKYLSGLGFGTLVVSPGAFGTPFLPRFRLAVIPTGFANPQYSSVLPALRKGKGILGSFVSGGGALLVFGALVPEYTYDWLPVPFQYVQRYSRVKLNKVAMHDASMISEEEEVDCDGYLKGAGWNTVLTDGTGETVLAVLSHGHGIIIVTTIHEYPSQRFIRWLLDGARGSRL